MRSKIKRSAENNPFRVSKFESLKWLPHTIDLKKVFEIWGNNNFRGQIIGNHGAGKSTLAKKLQRFAEAKGFECIFLFANAQSQRPDFKTWKKNLKAVNENSLVIFDSISHASLWRKRQLLKLHPKSLFLLHKEIKKMPIICTLAPNAEILTKLAKELAGEEASILLQRCGGPQVLLQRHNANLRECFFELYKIWLNPNFTEV